MFPLTSDLDVVDMESGHSRRLLGGVYPEGDHSSDILITSNEHAPSEMLPNFVSKRKLAQAGFEDLDGLPDPGPVYCGDGVCGGELQVVGSDIRQCNNVYTATPVNIPPHGPQSPQRTKTSIRVVGTAARAALAGMENVRHGWVSHGCWGSICIL